MTLRVEAGWDQFEYGTATLSVNTVPASVSVGKYGHRDITGTTYTDFATALNAAIVAAGITSFVVSYSTTTGLYTFAISGPLTVSLGVDHGTPAFALMGKLLGVSTSPGSTNTFSSDITPWFQINGEVGGASDASDDYEPNSISEDAEADDASHYAVTRVTAPTYNDFMVAMEPRAAVYKREAVASAAFTWQHLFEHCRAVHPFIVADDFGDVTSHYMRAGQDAFKPMHVAKDWRELLNIPLKTRMMGRTDNPLAGGSPLAISGTEREDETLTASGGTAPYEWTLVSDGTVLGSASTLVIPASAVGDTIRLTDNVAATDDTAVVGSSALGWFSAADYAAGGIQNRGLMTYPVVDDTLGGPAVGTDELGPYCDFTGVDGLQTTFAELSPYAGTAFTVYCLIDTAAGAASTFAGEMYQTGERIAIRHVTGGNLDLLVTDQGYQTYGTWADDACELSCFVLDGATGDRKGYHDATVHSGEVCTPNGFTGSVDFSFGGLYTGTQAPDGKVRFIAFYPSAHDATKRAEVRAALKRTWAHVDTAPLAFAGVVSEYNADTVTKDGSNNVSQLNDGVGANDLPFIGTTQGVYVADTKFNSNAHVRVLSTDAGKYELGTGVFDWGATSDEHSSVHYMEFVTHVNGRRPWDVYSPAGGEYPFITETPTGFTYNREAGASVGVVTAAGEETVLTTTDNADFQRVSMGAVFGETAAPVTPVVHGATARFRLLGNGSSPDIRWRQSLFWNRGLTQTEVLLARCWGNATYGSVIG